MRKGNENPESVENVEKNANVEEVKNVENTPKDKKEKIYVHYRKPSIFSSILLLLIGVCIATIVLGCVYIFKIKPNETATTADTEATQVEQNGGQATESNVETEAVSKYFLNLDVGGDIYNLLYDKLPKKHIGRYPIAYGDTKVDVNTVSENELAYYVLTKCEYEYMTDYALKDKLSYRYQRDENHNIEVRKINYTDAAALYRRYYGKSIPETNVESGAGYVYEFNQEDRCYYGHSYPGGGGSSFYYLAIPRKMEISNDGNELYLYDLFTSINYTGSSANGNVYAVYSDNTSNNPIIENVTESYDNGQSLYNGGTLRQILELEIYSKGGEYKHTFRKNEYNNYVWVCSEKLN